MKRLTAVLLAALLSLTLTACDWGSLIDGLPSKEPPTSGGGGAVVTNQSSPPGDPPGSGVAAINAPYSTVEAGNVSNLLTITIPAYNPGDTTPPTLTAGTVNRTSDTAATVPFTSDEAGTYYYQIGGTAPTAPALIAAGTNATALTAATNTISLTTLTAGAHDIYIAATDAAGNPSNLLTISIPAYNPGDATPPGGDASGATGSDTVYFNQEAGADISIPLTLNGNTFTGIEGLTDGVEYTYDGGANTVILKKEYINQKFSEIGSAYGTFATLVMKFSSGANWTQYLVKFGVPVFYESTGSRGGIVIPADYNGSRVRRITAYQGGGRVGPNSSQSEYLENGEAFSVDFGTLTFRPEFFDSTVTDGEIRVEIEFYDGQHVNLFMTVDGNEVTAKGATSEEPDPTDPEEPDPEEPGPIDPEEPGPIDPEEPGGGTPTNPTPTKPTAPVNDGSVKVDYTEKDGTVTLALPDAKIQEIISRETDKTASFDLTDIKEAETAVLDVNAAQKFSDADITVTLRLPNATITFDPDALAHLTAATDDGKTLITVEAAIIPMKDLKGMQAAQVKGYETVVNVDVFVGKDKVDVPVTISLPYTLKANEQPAAVCVWHLDDNGNLTKMNGVYDEKTGMITFTAPHQSLFVVGYDPVALWINVFSDIADGVWYYDAVAYANYYGLFNGDGNGRFMPQQSMTRAMFVTVLWNLEGKPIPNGAGRFTDAAPGTWYHNPVQWAAESGIVSGVGGGKYAPNRAITRQEMAVMLMNYAKLKGYDIPENRSIPVFKDRHEIDLWADSAAKALSEAGVISGDEEEFMPHKEVSRAEVAQMFRNFIRFIVGK